MHRLLTLSTCALLTLVVAGCGATHADAHHAARHAATAPPPTASAAWVADQYFVATAFPDESAHVTGEFARRFANQPTLGSLLSPNARVALRPLFEQGDSAVVAATVTDPAHRRVSEWYSYLVRERGTWKMYSLRTVEFTPGFHARADSLATRREDSSMAVAAGSDSALRAFVASHAARLDSLVAAYRATPNARPMLDVRDSVAPGDAYAAVHRLLSASDVTTVFYNPANPACTFVRIAGEGRRQVGAIRAGSGCRIPPMNPAGLVYTEHVQGDWYVYRAL